MGQEFIVAGLAQGVGTGVSGQHLGALVPIRNDAVFVDDIDTVVQVVDEFLVERLFHGIDPNLQFINAILAQVHCPLG